MSLLLLSLFAAVAAFFVAGAAVHVVDAVLVVRAYRLAHQGSHRPTAASFRMCHGSPRVRRAQPAWSHRRRA